MSAPQIIFTNLTFYLLGFVVLLALRKIISEQTVSMTSLLISSVGVLMSLGLIVVGNNETYTAPWFTVVNRSFTFDLMVNNLTLLLYFIVQFVGFWVQFFSVKYMADDPDFGRYFAYLNLFIFSMLGIVVAGNLLVLFFFWELVGLSSFLLIGFWYGRPAAGKAATKAFIVNRVGDVGFLFGIFLVYTFFGTLSLTEIRQEATQLFADYSIYSPSQQFVRSGLLTTMGLALFCGCIGKSAQFPLEIWLPDAMQGPTPVSALIHAATMVAAGIFLMARIDCLLTPAAGVIIAIVGVITALLAGFSAIYQYDIKKVLAYSTVSQLGLMVMGIGIGATNAALFHLTTHAFFKAGLFLAAGAVIHYLHHEQDIRKMGNLRRQMPVVFWCFAICAAALCGLPFFSGFLSKDALLISGFAWAEKQRGDLLIVIPMAAVFASAMTAFYITRLFIIVFFDRDGSSWQALRENVSRTLATIKQNLKALASADEIETPEKGLTTFLRSLGPMEISLLVMAAGSFFLPYSVSPLELRRSWFDEAFPVPLNAAYHWVSYAMLLITVICIWLSYVFSREEVQLFTQNPDYSSENRVARIARNHFYLDAFYENVIVKKVIGIPVGTPDAPVGGLSGLTSWLDTQVIDPFVDGVASATVQLAGKVSQFEKYVVDRSVMFMATSSERIGSYTRRLQGGKLQSYVMTLAISLILVIILIYLVNR